MNNDEARFILTAYRPGGQDAQDPAFADAIRQARSDPGLHRWWEREQAFDAAVAGRLREAAPPPGLREAILAGGRLSGGARRRANWTYVWLAAAAVLVMALGLGEMALRALRRPESPAALAQFALGDLRAPGHIGDPDTPSRAVLEQSAAAIDRGGLPLDFSRMESDGCRSLRFGGRKVIEVCFRRGGIMYHLYLLPRREGDDVGAAEAPVRMEAPGGVAAAWADARFIYAVAAKGTATVLDRVL